MDTHANVQSWSFLAVVLAVFLLFFAILHIIDFVPEVTDGNSEIEAETAIAAEVDEATVTNPTPTRIIIDAIGVDSVVSSPNSRDIDVLDEALLDGVVHYPGSALLNDDENMFLFGHSSRLPVVHNQAFKVFNRLSDLEEGQIIRVQGNGVENVYRVRSVELVNANEALVTFGEGEKQLTLSTCDSFGAKDDRFVVKADFIGSYQLD